MISQIFTQDCFKIMILFSLSPGSKFNRKEIKEKVRLNNVPLDKALVNLSNSKMLKKEGKIYALDFENEHTQKLIEIVGKDHKKLKTLPLIVFYLLVDLISFLSLERKIEVFLFGSYAKLIYKEKSDVDIAVLYFKKIDKKQINKIVLKLERVYNKNIEIHYFDKMLFYKNKKDPLIKDILRNGERLI